LSRSKAIAGRIVESYDLMAATGPVPADAVVLTVVDGF
jgi:hypothetical protein